MATVQRKLYRLPDEGMICGVASGLARYLTMDVTLMRLLFVGAIFITQGGALVGYFVLALVMPKPGAGDAKNFGEKIEGLANEVRANGRLNAMSTYLGLAIILIGAWLLLGQFVPQLISLQWNIVWPIAMVIIGIVIIIRSKNRE